MSTDHKEFYLRARARTPGCYDVFPEKSKDAAYFIKGSVASRSGLKTLSDLGTDEQLFQVTESINSLRQRMYIVDLRTKEAYSLRKVAFLPWKGHNRLQVLKGKEEGGTHIINIDSNWARNRATISDVATNETIAKITRNAFSGRRIAIGADAYVVSAAASPDANYPFVLMLTVCFDAQYNDVTK